MFSRHFQDHKIKLSKLKSLGLCPIWAQKDLELLDTLLPSANFSQLGLEHEDLPV